MLGKRIKDKRIGMRMTLEDVATKININKATLQRYESGVITNIPSDKIEQLAQILDCSPAYLMGWEDNLTHDNAVLQADLLGRPDVLEVSRKLIQESEEFVAQIDGYVDFMIEQKNKG